jgi:hypothetical protein
MRNLLFSISAAVLGTWFLWSGLGPQSGVPSPSSLKQASGNVTWAESDRTSVFFRLSGSDRTYVYASRAGDLAAVSSYLSPAFGPKISVLYGPDEATHNPVWEISAYSRPLRTYEQVQHDWTRNNNWAVLGGVALILAAAYLYRESTRETAPSEA